MCTGYTGGSVWSGISSLFFIPTQCLRIHFFPLKIWKCQIMISLHAFDLTSFRTFVVFSFPHLCLCCPPTPACLSFPSGRFLIWAGRLWRALPQIQNFCVNLFSCLYPSFALVPTFFFQPTYLFFCYGKESLPWKWCNGNDAIIFTDSQTFQVGRGPHGLISPTLQ